MSDRPTPEALLQQVQAEELKQTKGKLKIFFGAAPGVGKTHAMLEEALEKRSKGLDIVVGVVESHGRQDVEKLIANFNLLPKQEVAYRDKILTEFDLDTAIERHPGLLLVDEMAHTNAPGSRHDKRWQDIQELIDCGIDVYTTLNVQHVESLNDIVAQITGVSVRETVPDPILESADTIELVDLPPEDLLKRLEEGKVYFPKQAELATKNFFKKSNLIGLRELALRFTAQHVNIQSLSQRRANDGKIFPTSERLLVCVGPGKSSAKLIRAARRMASSFHADWLAVCVDAPRLRLSEDERQSAIQNLRLAEQLGAETVILNGTDVVKEVMDFARLRNVTKLIVSKQIRPRWKDWIFGSLVDELVRSSGEIDVYVIPTTKEREKQAWFASFNFSSSFDSYVLAMLSIVVATIINFFLYKHIASSNLIMIYLLVVVFVARRGERGPSMLASLLSVIFYDFFFIPPQFKFNLSSTQYIITLLVMLLVTQIISQLTIVTHEQEEKARLNERRTAALHALSRQLASSRGVSKLLMIAIKYIAEIFESEVTAFLPNEHGHLTGYGDNNPKNKINEKEEGIIQWVFDMGQSGGLGTSTLPVADAVYLPLLGSQGTVGVLKVKPHYPKRLLIPDQMHLLEACANQTALALEVDRFQEEAVS
jgi:two-component system sensor histidine kinase KdpD